jgi:hypothetical protein
MDLWVSDTGEWKLMRWGHQRNGEGVSFLVYHAPKVTGGAL